MNLCGKKMLVCRVFETIFKANIKNNKATCSEAVTIFGHRFFLTNV